jgi:hypothetical protein
MAAEAFGEGRPPKSPNFVFPLIPAAGGHQLTSSLASCSEVATRSRG